MKRCRGAKQTHEKDEASVELPERRIGSRCGAMTWVKRSLLSLMILMSLQIPLDDAVASPCSGPGSSSAGCRDIGRSLAEPFIPFLWGGVLIGANVFLSSRNMGWFGAPQEQHRVMIAIHSIALPLFLDVIVAASLWEIHHDPSYAREGRDVLKAAHLSLFYTIAASAGLRWGTSIWRWRELSEKKKAVPQLHISPSPEGTTVGLRLRF